MAVAKNAYRTNAIGISAGLGLALPLAAYAATLPLDGVNDLVRADAMPFSVGILAGVGMLAVTSHLIESRMATDADEDVQESDSVDAHADAHTKAERTVDEQSRRGMRFARATSNDVPVISRAANAEAEAAAWAEIDAMSGTGVQASHVEAPAANRYQLALDELHNAPAPAQSAPTQNAAAPAQAANGFAVPFDDLDEVTDYQAAMESLYGSAASIPQQPIISAPVAPAASAPVAAQAAAPEPEQDVETADYAGHENMWAAALAIMDDEGPTPLVEHIEVPQTATAATAETAEAARRAAVEEGINATKLHSRVNTLIEEEFEKAMSKSVRHTTHEYLKVIEGGTMSMPALKQAEA